MQSVYGALLRKQVSCQLVTSFTRCAARRPLATGRGSTKNYRSDPPEDGKNGVNDEDNLFHPNNISDLSPHEVAKLRVTYGLVKQHAHAIEKNLEAVDPETNPMIDPRSFDIRKLPKLPPEILAEFRKEMPGDVAAGSRPVSLHSVWDAPKTDEPNELGPELQNDRASEWAVVDERTMEPRLFSKMQRQSFTSSGDVSFRGSVPAVVPHRRKKICPLKDERGRVKVDFRAVGTLSTYLSENGKILPKRKSGLSAKAQRKVAKAVKTARTMALLSPELKPGLTREELFELERTLQ